MHAYTCMYVGLSGKTYLTCIGIGAIKVIHTVYDDICLNKTVFMQENTTYMKIMKCKGFLIQSTWSCIQFRFKIV
jgi:hypothetical protein